jgi:predicted ATPase/class 3 adenylate cyclase
MKGANVAERDELVAAVAALETQRGVLGDAVLDAALGPMREKLAALDAAQVVPTDDGERKIVTVIFADLSGSTALGEVMDPEEIRGLLNSCFDRLVPVVKHFGGTVDKFQGDNIMALFGAPVAHENDPERALRACLGMMDALDEFNREMDVNLGFHIGVNTGLVIAGGVGSKGDQSYSVMGDTVNVAARLEAAAVRGEIIVGPDTYQLAEPFFEFEDRKAIQVKGRDEPVKIYQLLSAKAGHHSARGIEGLSSPLVGRDREVDLFRGLLRDVADGRGGVVAVVAEAGVGKSRFVADVEAASLVEATWAQGRALAYTVDTPYAMVNDLIRDLLGVASDASLDDVSGALAGHLAWTMAPATAEREWPYLANLLHLPLQPDAARVIDGFESSRDVLRTRTVTAFTTMIRSTAKAGPLVVVWEDLHWADAPSIQLLEALLPLTAEVPILVVAIYRPSDGPATAFQEHLVDSVSGDGAVIALGPLSRADAEQLLDELLQIDNLPTSIRDLILERAQGNPLFLEELLRSLIDAGYVIVESDRAVASDKITQLDAIDIPDTVHGVIGARIDRLAPSNKDTLQTASVLGRSFQRRVLEHLNTDSTTIGTELDELTRTDFIEAETDLLTEYMFKHVFTQEAAYNGMLRSRRRVLHQTAAETIETLFPERVEELAPNLAGHYEAAGNTDMAIFYLLQAAEHAVEIYANDEALDFVARGLAITDEGDARFELLTYRCGVLSVIGQRDGEREAIEALETIAQAHDDDSKRLVVETKHVGLSESLGEWEDVVRGAERMLALAGRLDDAEAEASAHIARGRGLARMSQLDEAERELQRSIAIADNAGPEKAFQRIKLKATTNLGMVHFGRKDFDRSRATAESALMLAEEIGDRYVEGTIHQNLGILGLSFGDYSYCRSHLTKTIQIAREIGSQNMAVGGLSGLGEAEFLDGNYTEALEASLEALAIARDIEAGWWITFQMRSAGDTLIALDRADEATPLMEQSVAGFREAGSTPHVLDGVGGLARAHMAQGDTASAASVIEEAATHILDGNDVDGAAYPLRIYATCLDIFESVSDGRYVDMLTAATEALYRLYPDGGNLPWHEDIRNRAKLGSKPRP